MSGPTRDDIERWLGGHWRVVTERVEASKWSDLSWRTEFLCRKVRLDRYYVYDEPASEGERLIAYATSRRDA